mgnify:CR=1 FL=1
MLDTPNFFEQLHAERAIMFLENTLETRNSFNGSAPGPRIRLLRESTVTIENQVCRSARKYFYVYILLAATCVVADTTDGMTARRGNGTAAVGRFALASAPARALITRWPMTRHAVEWCSLVDIRVLAEWETHGSGTAPFGRCVLSPAQTRALGLRWFTTRHVVV